MNHSYPSPLVAVRFFFDPACPWAWRTSLWMREVAQVRPVSVAWDFLSLKATNTGTEALKESHFTSEPSFRVMALLRRRYAAAEANLLIDRLYLAVGRARHERSEDIGQQAVVAAALQESDCSPELLTEAMDDPTTLDDVLQAHERAVALGGFGVPSLLLHSATVSYPAQAMFGPVLSEVPTGEDAGQLWDHIAWMIQRPEFFELKRSRS